MLRRHARGPRQLPLDRLRQDRILDEAFATGDPLKLMRLFGITEQTAMRYVGTAYPELMRISEIGQGRSSLHFVAS
ncbi:hypothetical protein ABT032_48085 [Streptomyces flaveus]